MVFCKISDEVKINTRSYLDEIFVYTILKCSSFKMCLIFIFIYFILRKYVCTLLHAFAGIYKKRNNSTVTGE